MCVAQVEEIAQSCEALTIIAGSSPLQSSEVPALGELGVQNGFEADGADMQGTLDYKGNLDYHS